MSKLFVVETNKNDKILKKGYYKPTKEKNYGKTR